MLEPVVDSYLTFVSEEQRQVGVQVNQAARLLEHTLIDLLRNMRSRAQVASSLAERIFSDAGYEVSLVLFGFIYIRCVGVTRFFPLQWGRTS